MLELSFIFRSLYLGYHRHSFLLHHFQSLIADSINFQSERVAQPHCFLFLDLLNPTHVVSFVLKGCAYWRRYIEERAHQTLNPMGFPNLYMSLLELHHYDSGRCLLGQFVSWRGKPAWSASMPVKCTTVESRFFLEFDVKTLLTVATLRFPKHYKYPMICPYSINLVNFKSSVTLLHCPTTYNIVTYNEIKVLHNRSFPPQVISYKQNSL